jgi:hypothetical protein
MPEPHRCAAIAAGYLAAILAASLLLVGAILAFMGGPFPAEIDYALVEVTARMVALVTGLVAIVALLPMLGFGIYAERAGIRSPWFYTLAGGCIGMLALGLQVAASVWQHGWAESFAFDSRDMTLAGAVACVFATVAVAGLGAGLAYWAVTGRSAGAKEERAC